MADGSSVCAILRMKSGSSARGTGARSYQNRSKGGDNCAMLTASRRTTCSVGSCCSSRTCCRRACFAARQSDAAACAPRLPVFPLVSDPQAAPHRPATGRRSPWRKPSVCSEGRTRDAGAALQLLRCHHSAELAHLLYADRLAQPMLALDDALCVHAFARRTRFTASQLPLDNSTDSRVADGKKITWAAAKGADVRSVIRNKPSLYP